MYRGGVSRPFWSARLRLIGCSAAAIAAGGGGAANAACTPNPPQTNGTTICTGRTDGGLVASVASTINVVAGATLAGGSGNPGLTVSGPRNYYETPFALNVDGTVDGAGNSGVLAIASTSGTRITIRVSEAGVIRGSTAISLRADGGSDRTYASLDNSGSIRSDSGAAIVGSRTAETNVLSLTNRESGFIGGLDVQVGSLINQGTIDGGAVSAYRFSDRVNLFGIGSSTVNNSGVMRSASADATISTATAYVTVTNSGTIANTGTGAGVSTNFEATLTNQAGGTIASAGAVAVRAGANALTFTNRGSVTGSVVTGSSAFSTSLIDTAGGTISGDVLLGAGDDRVIGTLDAAKGGFAEISGRVDGGAGRNVAEFGVGADATLSAFTAPTNFQQVQFTFRNNAALTLGGNSPFGVLLAGTGRFTNTGNVDVSGTAVGDVFIANVVPQFTNRGTVTARLTQASDYGVRLSYGTSLANENAITAIGGNGVFISGSGGLRPSLANSGTITATGTGVTVGSGTLVNSGTIRSTAGTGVALSLGGGVVRTVTSTNSGLIEGATVGASTDSIILVNGGTIRATNGVGVTSRSSSTIDNLAGGVILGTAAAINVDNNLGFGVYVRNAGTINGDVSFERQSTFGSSEDNIYIDAGGTLNGNLRLGSGMLVTDPDRLVNGRFAGATGPVDGAIGSLRLRVRENRSFALDALGGFRNVGFELYNAPALTLTASRPFGGTLQLAGEGSVDLSADIVAADRSLITLNNQTSEESLNNLSATSKISLVSRGALTVTATGSSGASAVLLGPASFENAGSISVSSTGASSTFYGIFGSFSSPSGSVTNPGTITLAGTGTGIIGVAAVVNSGRIVQATGDTGTALGVARFATLRNSGTIETRGTAVTAGFNGSYATITNSGRIASTSGAAIVSGGVFATTGLENQAGGTIAGGSGTAIQLGWTTTIVNAGRIIGDVRLDSGQSAQGSATYVAAGGTIQGNLTFGSNDDILVVRGGNNGVSGTINGGAGTDRYVRSFDASTTVSLGAPLPATFEEEGIEARGANTVVTLAALSADRTRPLALYGNGAIVSAVDIAAGSGTARNLVNLAQAFDSADAGGLAFNNQARIADGVSGVARSFTNTGAIGSAMIPGAVVDLQAQPGADFVFDNAGTIQALGNSGYSIGEYPGYYDVPAIRLSGYETADGGLGSPLSAAIANRGTIAGGLSGDFASATSLTNSGTISRDAQVSATAAISSHADFAKPGAKPSVSVINSGTITATGRGGAGLTAIAAHYGTVTPTISRGSVSVVNSGTISATADGEPLPGNYVGLTYVASAGVVLGGDNIDISLNNLAAGTIAAPNRGTVAIAVNAGGTFALDNAGTITGSAGVTVNPQFHVLAGSFYLPDGYLAGAIEVVRAASTIRNSGTITGSIQLGGGNDRIENYGTINGNVFLGAGDDTFVQSVRAVMNGTVDGGDGLDSLIVDGTGGGSVDGSRFVNFERFSQIGAGAVSYAGTFAVDTIHLDGGTLTVASGQRLATASPTTITGGAGMESVQNFGTIAGGIDLGDGNDSVDNRGRIDGDVWLGAGDDSFTEGAGSSVGGTIDGGAGTDTYIVALAGDRSGIAARSNFERLGVTGPGTLTLALDQSFELVSLSGSGLDLRQNGFAVGRISGSDAAERLTLDGDVAAVALGGGDDVLRIAGTTLGGSYDGGAGTDLLALTAPAPVTLSGKATGFETVSLAGGALTVTGSLGSTDGTTGFGDGAQALTVGNGGRLIGAIDLGAGNDSFRLAAGGQLLGTVSGGAGIDAATLELTADMAITGDTLRDFETLTTTGGKTLTLSSGTSSYDRIDAGGGLTVASGAALNATQVRFGAGDDRFTIAGTFTGSADGGAGTDTLALSGGSAATPITFQTISGFEAMTVSGGFTTVAGTAQFGRIDMTGGRLVGLAGSTIAAPVIAIGSGATFGSAGSVIGNIAVAGTLSPGASPGTMTVTGNVSLAAGSTSLFELTPTVSDKLLVSGTLSIASGATLTLTGTRPLTPGAALDLIVAGGCISGSFSTIAQVSTIAGFVRQSADRIQLFGQFANAGFNPQVSATINYVNAVLTGGQASAGLIAAIPSLLAGGNATNGPAFARLNPEVYASATQIGVENGLTLAKAARSSAAAGRRDEAGAFTFVQGLGGWRSLNGDDAAGTSRTELDSYGVLGGIGFGTASASLGGFVGYLDSRQRVPALAARTNVDGLVGGLIGHVAAAGFDLSALLAYDGGKGVTRRPVPGGATAISHYDLHNWVSDTSLGYALPLSANWSLKPEAGLTYVDTRRSAATETGAGAFSLAVARRRSHVTFVDGALTLSGGMAPGATFHPWVSAGVRHQLDGQGTFAAASFAGTSAGFSVIGVRRQGTLATAGAGVSAELTPRLGLFAAYRGEFGKDGTGAALNGGLILRF